MSIGSFLVWKKDEIFPELIDNNRNVNDLKIDEVTIENQMVSKNLSGNVFENIKSSVRKGKIFFI